MGRNLRPGIRVGPAGRALEESVVEKTGAVDWAETVAKSDASLLIRSAMEAAKVSNAELARRLDCDRARVTRLLDGGQNLTIGTLASALHALGFALALAGRPIAAPGRGSDSRSIEPAGSGAVGTPARRRARRT